MRNVFFSFDYQDVWRTNVVRNSWITQYPGAAGFQDRSLWEEAKNKGDAAIKKMIDDGLKGTSVTVVLIGSRTAGRKYVSYEIERSVARGNGFVAIHLAGIGDPNEPTKRRGANPLGWHYASQDSQSDRLVDIYRTYDWVADEGFKNLGKWVEEAAVTAGRPQSQSSSRRPRPQSSVATLGTVLAIGGVVVGVAGILWAASRWIEHRRGSPGAI